MPQDKSRAQGRWAPLSLGALGVVYGQIGTSPLYALREAFQGAFGLPVTPENVLGVLSLFTWAIFLIVVVKYLTILLRADHQGQGGFLALLTLLTQGQLQGWRRGAFVALGLAGAALLYGDGLITPAMSVLSAVEGLAVVAPGLEDMVVPVTVAILLTLFAVQRRCTGSISIVFGPVILLWMFTIGILGAHGIASHPQVLAALNPLHGARLLASNGKLGFLALGAVVLAVTSGEALYADLGHFGRLPIRISWYAIVFPALLSNYFGQGALLLTDRAGV